MRTRASLIWTLAVCAVLIADGLTCLPRATAQALSPRAQQAFEKARGPGVEIPLDIYNFTMGGRASDASWSEGFAQAVSDALLLQLLGQSRIQARRVREEYRPTASAETGPLTRSPKQQRVSEGRTRYVLDGRIGRAEPPGSAGPRPERFGPPHFLIIKYWLREVGEGREPKILLDADEMATLKELPAALARISERVLLKLIPPSLVSLRAEPLQLSGFPEERKSFYVENLSELLQAELQSEGWIELAGGRAPAEYSVTEDVSLRDGNYELRARLFLTGRDEVLASLSQSGPARDVLAGQLRVARRIVEELRTRRALLSSGANPGEEPSAAGYLQAAEGYEETDPDLAVPLYRRAMELDPTNLKARLSLAHALLHKERAAEALKILQSPDVEKSAMGQLMRSLAYAVVSQREKAQEAADRAVELAPQAAVAYWWRGRLYGAANDFKKALPDYQKALELEPTNADYYEVVARVNEELKNYARAVEVLSEGRKRAKQGEKLGHLQNDVRRRAAVTLLQSKRPDQALAFARTAAEDEPDSDWGLRILGMTYHALGRLGEAESTLARALAVKETPESLSEMAAIHLDQGRKASARMLAMKSIEKDPDGAQAIQVLVGAVSTPAEAKPAVEYLKVVWKKRPSSLRALDAWDYLQLIYLPNDPAEISQLYAAYASALQPVAYRDWMNGWANMVEVALLDGKYKESATIATDLLQSNPTLEYLVNLRFYLWLTRLVQGDCAEVQAASRAFAELLRQRELDGFDNSWNFTGTRRWVLQVPRAGALDDATRAQVQSALDLLESHPLRRARIDAFLASVPSGGAPPCPSTRITIGR